jgi:glycine cleavage system H protein
MEQIGNLRRLELEKCEPREYVALNWVRHFLTCPGGVPAEIEEEFVSTFTPQEQLYIKTSMKGMFCFNLLLSTLVQGKTGTRFVSLVEKSLLGVSRRRRPVSRGKPGSRPISGTFDFPEDIRYHKEHMWLREDGTIGITFYAQGQLGEIMFIEIPEAGAEIRAGEVFGAIESLKSVSDLYAPVTGTITDVNSEAIEAPELVNQDPYGAGWIAKVKATDTGKLPGLLSAREYKEVVYGEEASALQRT